MAFWGVEIKPGKPYFHNYNDEKGRLHVSQATLGTGSSKDKAVVVCQVGENKPVYLCSLMPKKVETCPLNVEFEEYEEVTFSVEGPHSIHLSGFFYGESPDSDTDGSDSDSYEDESFEVGSGSEYDSESEEDDFSDRDVDMFSHGHVANSGVSIEEIFDEEQTAKGNGMSEGPKRKKSSDGNNEQQIVVGKETSPPILESEDEDGFPKRTFTTSDTQESGEKTEELTGEGSNRQVKRKKTKGDSDLKSAKRKKDEEGDQARKTSELSNSTDETLGMLPETNVKKSKKKKMSKGGVGKTQEAAGCIKSTIQPQGVNDVKKTSDKGLDANAKSDAGENFHSEKNKKKNKQLEKAAGSVSVKKVSDKNRQRNAIAEKAEAKLLRTFANGMKVEELEMGKPDGKRASPGKKVSVRYVGKLQKDGTVFDSNIGKAPFKFRLGIGEVIKGWDVGVLGMRVGDKRRLTIPPSMGYGAEGAGVTIPPNATLVFEVELLGVL